MGTFIEYSVIAIVISLLFFFLLSYTVQRMKTEMNAEFYVEDTLEPSEEVFHRNIKLINNGDWRKL